MCPVGRKPGSVSKHPRPAGRVIQSARGWSISVKLENYRQEIVGICTILAFLVIDGPWTFDARVRAYILSHPTIIEEANQVLVARQVDELSRQMRPTIQAHRSSLMADPRDPFVGPRDAKVVVVEFFDYRCSICKVTAAPRVAKLIKAYPDVKFVFKELPIFGGPSKLAASTAIAVFQLAPDKYLAVHEAMMAQNALQGTATTPAEQATMNAAIASILRAEGLDPVAVSKRAASPEIAGQLNDVKSLATALKIDGTPTFIVGDRLIVGANMDEVEKQIAKSVDR